MRRFTPSGSRPTSMPPTDGACRRSAGAARTACGWWSTCRRRCCRGSRRSRPRRTSNDTSSTATKPPKRRVSAVDVDGAASRVSVACIRRSHRRAHRPSARSSRASARRDAGERAGAVELRLQQRELARRALRCSSPRRPDSARRRRAAPRRRCGRRRRPRRWRPAPSQISSARWRTLDGQHRVEVAAAAASTARAAACRLGHVGRAPAAVPQRPAHVDAGVPGVVPLGGAREDPRVRPRVVVRRRRPPPAAVAAAARRRLVRAAPGRRRLLERAPLRARPARARSISARPRRRPGPAAASSSCVDLDRRRRASPVSRARSAMDALAQVARLDRAACAGARAAPRPTPPRSAARGLTASRLRDVADVALDARQRLLEHRDRRSRAVTTRPEGARDLEPQVGPRRRRSSADGAGLGLRRASSASVRPPV